MFDCYFDLDIDIDIELDIGHNYVYFDWLGWPFSL